MNVGDCQENQRKFPLRGGYVPELDGIRAIAIGLVILFHCRTVAPAETVWQQLYHKIGEAGWMGVDLFFVLSGFLITGILLDTADSSRYFRSFYVRRVLRIFPLYYAMLLAAAFGFHILGINRLWPSLLAESAHWLYVQNWLPLFQIPWTHHFAHLWSLGVEEQFYLFWPALILIVARRGLAHQLCLVTIVFAVAMRIIFWFQGESEAGNFATVTRLDTLAVGAYLACLLRQRGPTYFKTKHMVLALAGTGIMLAGVIGYGGSFYRPTNPYIFLYAYLPLAVFFGSFIMLALTTRPDGWFRRSLQVRPLIKLGRISYGIYVFHWPVVLLMQPYWREIPMNFWGKQLSFLVAVGTLSFIPAALSFRFLETPFLKLKDSLAPRGEASLDSSLRR